VTSVERKNESIRQRRTGVRLAVMLVVGLLAAGATAATGAWPLAPDVGWVAAALVYLAWVWLVIGPMDAPKTSRFATQEQPARSTSDLLLLGAATASLIAVVVVLSGAKHAAGGTKDLLAALALCSVALSWFMVHTLFTLRYAQLYYTGEDGGVNFNQPGAPRYVDFAYLAFTIGMTFQVSDTDVRAYPIRATALRHALLSYLFGAVVLASTVNLLAGLSG
jgi:uncharacterized membrane protein